MSIANNLDKVTARIQKATEVCGRLPNHLALIAVSKTRSAEEIRALAALGITRFGENYLQEALDKQARLSDLSDLEWHFIGPVQTNKTRPIAEHFAWVHSVDRDKVARRLSEQRPAHLPPLQVCIQVNIDQEDSKSGILAEQVEALAELIVQLPNLQLRGLMIIPRPDQPDASLRARFAQLATMLKHLQIRFPEQAALDTLSMGMSDDMELAIAEGATLLRIGTALFGSRATSADTSPTPTYPAE